MPLIPGVQYKAYGQKFQSLVQGPTTERLLIIGLSQDGPINTPVPVRDVLSASSLFGPATYQSSYLDPNTGQESGLDAGTSIPQAVGIALAAGARDIWVVRATGTYATGAVSGSVSTTPKLDMRSIYPGRVYNNTTLTLTTTGGVLGIYINQPAAKGGNIILPTLAATGTVRQLIDRINNDRRNRTIYINPETYPTILTSAAYTAIGSGVGTLRFGTNGTRATGEDYGPEAATGVAGYATKLLTVDTGTFDVLEGINFPFDVAVLTGIYADEQIVDSGQTKIDGTGTYSATDQYSLSIAADFAVWLSRMSNMVNPCRGVTAVRPAGLTQLSDMVTYITGNLLATTYGVYNSTLRWNKMGPFMYNGFRQTDPNTGDIVDLGARLSVVVGPEVVANHPDIGNFVDQPHVQYAAKLTTIPPERAPVLAALDGILGYNNPIPRKYADLLISGVGFDSSNQLSGRGAYVVMVKNPGNFQGPQVVYSDVTAAYREDYFSQDQLVHLCNRVESDVAETLRPFLGGPSDPSALAAMKTRVKNVLDGYAASGAFKGYEGQGYTFDITVDGPGSILGIVNVWIEMSPASAIRSIRITTAVRQSA